MGFVVFAVCIFFIPVQDTPYEGGDEGDISLSTRNSLGEWKQQSHVAMDPMFVLQLPDKKSNIQMSAEQLLPFINNTDVFE